VNKIKIGVLLLLAVFSTNSVADEKPFLNVDNLVDAGYTLLSGQQIMEIMADRTIRVVDIETDAVTVSEKDQSKTAMDRKFVETKSDNASSLLDPRLMARAPALEGKIERKVVGDELIATDGVRSYHYRLYKKHDKIFAVRDIDSGNVFFEIVIK